MMEADPALKHTISSLLGIARLRPALVIQALVSALETLAKVGDFPPEIANIGRKGIRAETSQGIARTFQSLWKGD